MNKPEDTIKHPTVSIVVCTYNGGAFLRPQLDSILAQTYPIEEIIIQDDQSNDGITPGIIQEYTEHFPNLIHAFTTKERKGINHNFLTALQRAKSDLIAWSDQDDVWLPNKIEKQVQAMGNNWICFHLTQSFTTQVPDPEHLTWDHRLPNFGLERTLFMGCVPGHTQLIRRDFFVQFMAKAPLSVLLNPCPVFYADTVMSIVANAYHKVVCIVEPLDFHRRRIESVTEVRQKDYSQRTLGNFIRQNIRALNPERRRIIKPNIERRFRAMLTILDCFQDAPYTADVRELAESYLSTKWYKTWLFTKALIKNRNRIFYAAEKNQLVATIRAILFNLTMYEYFSLCYKFAKEGRAENK